MRKLETWIDAEFSVIGALLLSPSCGLELDLGVHHFSQDTCRQAFQAIQALQAAAEPIDVLTVSNRLERETGQQWLAELGSWMRETPSAASVKAYAGGVMEHFRFRKCQEIAKRLLEDAGDEQAVDLAIRDLMAVSMSRRTFEIHGKTAINKGLAIADDATHGVSGAPTGLYDLDECLGGLHCGDLIVVGARPGVGKTAFMLNMAIKGKARAGIISSEQGHEQLGQRMLAAEAKVSVHRMRVGATSREEYQRMAEAVALPVNDQIWINDKPGISLVEIQRQARKWKFERNIEALYVDYLQRIKGGDGRAPRRERVGEVTQGLKELARELDIPIVVLAQLNRECEGRKPVISDLAESGEIEREADQILLLYREDEMHGTTMDVFVGKNRHGPQGKIQLNWFPEFMLLESVERRY